MDRNLSECQGMESTPSDSVATETRKGAPGPTSAAHRSGWFGMVIRLLLVVLGFGAGWIAANTRRDLEHKEVLSVRRDGDSRESEGVTVTIEPVARRSVQRSVEALGTLHGFEEVSISAQVEGRVRKVLHDVADRVKPVDLILEIDPTDYELAVQQSDRALQVELAKLGLKEPPDSNFDLTKVPVVVKAKSLMEHAKSRHERLAQLVARKTVSAEEVESAANDYRTARAEYDNQLIQSEAGLATIQLKQVDLLVAREHLANTRVAVPKPNVSLPGMESVSYVVSQRSVSEGTLVRPGTELFQIVISEMLKLRVPVPERYSAEIRQDQHVDVFVAASSIPVAGSVTRIYPTVDPATRTFQVEIQVPNPKGDLKPGSFAKAAIFTRIDSEAVTIPLAALVQFAGITKIFLADNGHAKEVRVTLGTQTTEWVEVTSPELPVNAMVVTSGQTALANESPITVREPIPVVQQNRSRSASTPDPATATENSRSPGRGVRE